MHIRGKILEEVILLILLIMISFYVASLTRREKEDTELREVVEEVTDQAEEGGGVETGEGPESKIFEKYPNLFGTLKIPGTRIDYPVAYIPNDSSFYLTHSISGEESVCGTPFLAGECFSGCKNLIIYGHHMADGSVFADLLNYKDYKFYKEHPNISLTTNTSESGEYQVVGAFYSKVGDPDFDYYNYYDLRDPERKLSFIKKLNQKKLYQTDTPAESGDEFITLSTCSYHVKNGRFVVVALKI